MLPFLCKTRASFVDLFSFLAKKKELQELNFWRRFGFGLWGAY
jgi:hypothetical protein